MNTISLMNKLLINVSEKMKLIETGIISLIFSFIFDKLELQIRYKLGVHIARNKFIFPHNNGYGLSIINTFVIIIPAIVKANIEKSMFTFDL